MRISRSVTVLSSLVLGISSVVIGQQFTPSAGLARMPVKEVSVFKDGHALVLHEGSVPTNASGNIDLDYLPTPVLGTFWTYTTDPAVKVNSVVAGRHRIVVERTALKLWEMLESNIGADVIVTEKAGSAGRESLTYPATILSIPRRTSEELQTTSPPNTEESLPIRGELILVRTAEGVKALPLDRIQDVVFKATPKSLIGEQEFRNLLTLRLDWANRTPERSAGLGIVYLQKGLRWIPSYRVAVDGNGSATLKLQGVLVNELTDLNGVTANLVIGVPSFAFKDTLDPLSLASALTPLSNYFQTSARSALSNAIGSQAMAPARPGAAPAEDPGPQVTDSSQAEDLFLFTLRNITLKKGQRLSVPVAEHKLKYKDIYTLDLPFSPPVEVRTNLNTNQQEEAGLLDTPRLRHKIRITNSGTAPLTTAPALIVRDERVLSQGIMLYTPPNATGDLEMGTAVDIQMTRSETESSRTPSAVRVNGELYTEVNLSGSIKLTNYRKESVEVELKREVLGSAKSASHNGRIERLNTVAEYPVWWRYYGWPNWWNQMNSIGRMTWNVTLAPGQSVDLNYTWQYYWR